MRDEGVGSSRTVGFVAVLKVWFEVAVAIGALFSPPLAQRASGPRASAGCVSAASAASTRRPGPITAALGLDRYRGPPRHPSPWCGIGAVTEGQPCWPQAPPVWRAYARHHLIIRRVVRRPTFGSRARVRRAHTDPSRLRTAHHGSSSAIWGKLPAIRSEEMQRHANLRNAPRRPNGEPGSARAFPDHRSPGHRDSRHARGHAGRGTGPAAAYRFGA
jgi:hypothetical protein